MFKVYDNVTREFHRGFIDYNAARDFAASLGYLPSQVNIFIHFAF